MYNDGDDDDDDDDVTVQSAALLALLREAGGLAQPLRRPRLIPGLVAWNPLGWLA